MVTCHAHAPLVHVRQPQACFGLGYIVAMASTQADGHSIDHQSSECSTALTLTARDLAVPLGDS